jgi:hypothetical protein
MTGQVVFAIYYQALRLWMKKCPYYAEGIFLCPSAAVKSSWKSRSTPDISNRLRHSGRKRAVLWRSHAALTFHFVMTIERMQLEEVTHDESSTNTPETRGGDLPVGSYGPRGQPLSPVIRR